MKQKTSLEKKISTRLTAIVVGATLMGFSAYAKEIGNFKRPSLKGYSFDKVFYMDMNEDGTNDTKIEIYKNNNGDKVLKSYKKGTNEIWSWGLDSTNDNNSNIQKNYIVVDTDGDGSFDTKYKLEEEIPLPSWVK